jgi:secreted PhoX family phosphatase
MNRRTFLRRGALLGGSFIAMGPFHALGARIARGQALCQAVGYGPLTPKGPELALPPEFEYQVIQRQGEIQRDGTPVPSAFDGMAAFPDPRHPGDTTILIRNHENRRRFGEIPVVVPAGLRYDEDLTYNAGCVKLVVRRHRRPDAPTLYEVVDSFSILGGTDTNCAGGLTPYKTWITCEEVVNRGSTGKKHGYIFEVDALADGPVLARPIPSAGRFVHEATAWHGGILYETEDRNIRTQGGSCFYRWIPERRVGRSGNLADTNGVLQALKLKNEFRANMDTGRVVGLPYPVEWVTIDNPDHEDDTDRTALAVRFQAQNKGAAFFDRQEGMWAGRGKVYFDCTEGGAQNLGQVWEYDPGRETITLIYESASSATLENPDNVVIVRQTGDILLCEDGPAPQFIRGLTQDGKIYDFAEGLSNPSEFAGACFDPDGQTLYVNQYGVRPDPNVPGDPGVPGLTYAIHGPFQKRCGNNSRNFGNGPSQ